MSIINQFRNGKISKAELRAMAEKDPALRVEVATALNEEMSDEELEGIAAAGVVYGTNGDVSFGGGYGDDIIDTGIGGDGLDTLFGDDGNE
ncbi:MAG: hypothetical protein OCC46_02510 [Pseudodesulfovibrio sp.]